MDKIHDSVWQGGYTSVMEAAEQVDRIVDLTSGNRYSATDLPSEVKVVNFPMRDGPLPDLAQLAKLVRRLAKLVEDGEKLYVHCASGINRSGLVGALLIREIGDVTGPEAIEIVEQRTEGPILRNQNFRGYVEGLGLP